MSDTSSIPIMISVGFIQLNINVLSSHTISNQSKHYHSVHSYCSFIQISDIRDGTAATIEEKLINLFQVWNIPTAKIVGYGSDGASVMVENRDGVDTCLKRLNNNIVSIHCAAHRLSLAASQAANGIPHMKRFKAVITN